MKITRKYNIDEVKYEKHKHNLMLETIQYKIGATLLTYQKIYPKFRMEMMMGLPELRDTGFINIEHFYYISKVYEDGQRLIQKETFERRLQQAMESSAANINRETELVEKYLYTDRNGNHGRVVVCISQTGDEKRTATIEFDSTQMLEAFKRPDWLLEEEPDATG